MNSSISLSDSFLIRASKRGDLIAAAMILGVVFVMILPVPVFLLDIMIGLNIVLSTLLLIITIYMPSSLSFSSFPTMLLLSTLIRLSLSVSTTRQILIDGDAGHIVEVFGNFVVAGNLVVGLVVFSIITIVNFLVVTKGSERVAEVAARFTLDGMPGKQMSIDSDLRAGLIDQNEAKARRIQLEKESQLFGAMDGSMKFVKGDAIAGIIIIFVNLLGGLAVGCLQRGMDLEKAGRLYSVLSIGDGLVAQIPSLLISIAAGMMITRVSQSDEQTSSLGSDLVRQLLGQPKASLMTCFIVFAMGLIPGMPTSVFWTIAALLALTSIMHLRSLSAEGEDTKVSELPGDTQNPVITSTQKIEDKEGFSPYKALHLESSGQMSQQQHSMYINAARQARNHLLSDFGAPLPHLSSHINPSEGQATLVVYLFNVPVLTHQTRLSQICVRESAERLRTLKLDFEEEWDSVCCVTRCWCDLSSANRLAELGLVLMDDLTVFMQKMQDTLCRNMSLLVGIQETSAILKQMESVQVELVREFSRLLPSARLAEIFQRLLSEKVSIRNMRCILQCLIEWAPRERDMVTLGEHVRVALKQQICHQYQKQGVIYAVILGEAFEDVIRGAIRQTAIGNYLALDPVTSQRLIDKIKEVAKGLDESSMPVLIVPLDLRRYIRKLLEQDLFSLPILSFNEILPELSVQTLALIEE